MLLTFSGSWQNVLVGLVVSVAAGFLFGNVFVETPPRFFQPQRWFWSFIYVPVFLWEMIKANFDVAYRVIHPKMPINPGIVKVKTKLKSEMGMAILANSITLTPGTFTVDVKDQYLYIHCINVRHTDIGSASQDIISRFESLLLKIFD